MPRLRGLKGKYSKRCSTCQRSVRGEDHPAGQRVKDKLKWAHELIALYEGE